MFFQCFNIFDNKHLIFSQNMWIHSALERKSMKTSDGMTWLEKCVGTHQIYLMFYLLNIYLCIICILKSNAINDSPDNKLTICCYLLSSQYQYIIWDICSLFFNWEGGEREGGLQNQQFKNMCGLKVKGGGCR